MRCSNCGWENPDQNQTCEKCNAPLGGGVSGQYARSEHYAAQSTVRENAPFEPQTKRDTVQDQPTIPDNFPQTPPQRPGAKGGTAPTSNFGGTVNPYAGPGGWQPVARCILKPVIFPGEDQRYVPQPVNLKGDYNELNRQLLDPDNNTITSKVQAALTRKDGKWYIKDESVQKTTFVYAGEERELKTGDIILMGNRTFVFEED